MDNRNRRWPNGLFSGHQVGRAIKVGYGLGVLVGVLVTAYYGGV